MDVKLPFVEFQYGKFAESIADADDCQQAT